MEENLLLTHENAERILEEGWRLFNQKGYRGVSIDELCADCQLSKPTLYYYFKDKENLFVSVMQHKLRGFHAAIEQPLGLEGRLCSIATAILDSFQVDYSTLMRDQEHLKKPENLARLRAAFHNELFGPLIGVMREGLDQGELKAENPEVLALLFMGMVNFFIGKAASLGTDNGALAGKIITYFFEGAKKI